MAAVRCKRRRRKLDRVGSKIPDTYQDAYCPARPCPPCVNFPQVLKEISRTLRRLGHLLVPGIFDGEHNFFARTHRAEPKTPNAKRTILRPSGRSLLGNTLLAATGRFDEAIE